MNAKFEAINARVDSVDGRIQDRFDGVDARIESLEKRIPMIHGHSRPKGTARCCREASFRLARG